MKRLFGLRLAVLVAIVAAFLAAGAISAMATPTDPTLDVAGLQAALDAKGGPLDGYLKTVVKGSEITTISVRVLAVTYGFGTGPADMSSLILFESDDPLIEKYGGIVSGMSGSPIYVDDAGTDKLIGALSYGDIFTTAGTGLATPIEAMMNIESNYALGMLPRRLTSPVVVDGDVIERVMVVPNEDAVGSAPSNTIVAAPMNTMFVGGLNPKSRMFKRYSKLLESKGVEVIGAAGGLSSVESTYNAPFEGGSAIAALAARGDMWAGGVGTVTYADDDAVLAFGHPAFWLGDTSLYMANAWVDGVWPNTMSPYKLARPAAVRGAITQDRNAGIMGIDGAYPEETTITARATKGSKVATSAVYVPRFVADASGWDFYGIAPSAVYVAGSRLFDAATNAGSAITTTTVTVLDESDDSVHTIVRRNVYSDSTDIAMAVVTDVDGIVAEIQSANGNGIAHAQILSVDLDTAFSGDRTDAQIADVTVAGGLKAGENTVTVTVVPYGEPTQTVDVPLTIPDDGWTPTTGQLTAYAVNYSDGGEISDELFADEIATDDYYTSIDRRTVKDVIADLESGVDNSVIGVVFRPALSGSGDEEEPVSAEYDPIEVTKATDWVVSGSASKTSPMVYVELMNGSTLAYGDWPMFAGEIFDSAGSGLVEVSLGGSVIDTVPVTEGMFFFAAPDPLFQRAQFTFTFLGDDASLPAQTISVVNVYAKVKLGASKKSVTHGSPVTLTARVYPATAGGSVSFQRYSGGAWKTLKTVTTPASGVCTYKYKPSKAGTAKLRARFNGSATNRAKASSTYTLTIK